LQLIIFLTVHDNRIEKGDSGRLSWRSSVQSRFDLIPIGWTDDVKLTAADYPVVISCDPGSSKFTSDGKTRQSDSGWLSCHSLMRSRFEVIHIRWKDDGGDSGRLSWCGLARSRFDLILIWWKDDGSDNGRLSWRALVHSRLPEKRRRAKLQGSTVLAWSRAILVWVDSHLMERWHWGSSGRMSWRGLVREISVQDHSRSPYHKCAMTWTPNGFE